MAASLAADANPHHHDGGTPRNFCRAKGYHLSELESQAAGASAPTSLHFPSSAQFIERLPAAEAAPLLKQRGLAGRLRLDP